MPQPPKRKPKPTTLRIISGSLKGRKIIYHGDPVTRPMRDSVRESLFNILFSTFKDSLCWDLFSGTGALAIEAISRGAHRAIAIELERKGTETIRQSLQSLGISERVEVINGDTFRLAARLLRTGDTSRRWIVFVCPPYELMEKRPEEIAELITLALESAPPGSHLVVEAEEHWDLAQLPPVEWDVRHYGSTRLAFAETPELAEPAQPDPPQPETEATKEPSSNSI